MYRKALKILLSLLIINSCSWFQPRQGEIKRTVLMYMIVSNNLKSSMSGNIEDIKMSPYVPKYFDAKEDGDVLLILEHFEGDTPRLKRIYRDDFGEVNEEILMEYPERSSTDIELLHEVLVHANSLFPAKENGLLLSSHGTGWLPEGYYRNPNAYGGSSAQFEEEPDPYAHLVKSFGQDGNKEIDIIELADALPIKYSYIIFDACLMGGIEVAYELKEHSTYQILSPTEIMAAGFPYDAIMEGAFLPNTPLRDRMKGIARNYYEFYKARSSQGGTIVMIESPKLEALAQASKNIYTRYSKNIENINMSTIQPYFRSSSRHFFYDFGDLMNHIGADETLLNSFKLSLDDAIVVKYHTSSFLNIKIKEYSGLSTYVQNPKNSYLDKYYKGYQWNIDTGAVK